MKTKRLKVLSILLMFAFLITACFKSSIPKEMYNKEYRSDKGGTIFIEKGKGSNVTLRFQGSGYITPGTEAKDLDDKEKKEKMDKGSKINSYDKATIIEENGKKYLKADGLEYKLEVIDNVTILDTEDNEKYIYIDINK